MDSIQNWQLAIWIMLLATGCTNINHDRELEHVQSFINRNSFNDNISILVDFSIHSGKNRMFVYDMKRGKVLYACPVSHGIGSGRDAVPNQFSNTPGSLMSSLGLATLGHRDYSPQGVKFKYWLDGHESTNNKMKQRLVVMHSYAGVPSQPIYPRRIITSEGCLMVGNEALHKLDNIIKAESNKKIVIYSFQNNRPRATVRAKAKTELRRIARRIR